MARVFAWMCILEDGTSKVFVCAKGCSDDVSENMKLFLDYLSGELSDNNLVRKLDDAVKFARKSKEWRAEYMLTHQDKLIMQHEYEALLSEKDEALAEKNAEIARLKALLDKKE